MALFGVRFGFGKPKVSMLLNSGRRVCGPPPDRSPPAPGRGWFCLVIGPVRVAASRSANRPRQIGDQLSGLRSGFSLAMGCTRSFRNGTTGPAATIEPNRTVSLAASPGWLSPTHSDILWPQFLQRPHVLPRRSQTQGAGAVGHGRAMVLPLGVSYGKELVLPSSNWRICLPGKQVPRFLLPRQYWLPRSCRPARKQPTELGHRDRICSCLPEPTSICARRIADSSKGAPSASTREAKNRKKARHVGVVPWRFQVVKLLAVSASQA